MVFQGLYTLFSFSVHRWGLTDYVMHLTVDSLSTTRWECRVDIIKAVRSQLPEIVKALKGYAREKHDPEAFSTAESICQEMQKWPFLFSAVVWYDVLFQINKFRKILQSPNVSIATLRKETMGVKRYRQEYHNRGFTFAKNKSQGNG